MRPEGLAASRGAGFMSTLTKSTKMSRADLAPLLRAEVEKWSAKTFETLRQELGKRAFADARSKSSYHVEVELLENRDEYVHVHIAVCHPQVPWSCIHPMSTSFIVHSNGFVDK